MFLVWFLEANAIFTQQIDFGKKRKSLFIAEPRSDFNRCYEQRMWKTTTEYYL